MENVIAAVLIVLLMAGMLTAAKRFLKPPKGPLPDCCGPNGNRNVAA